MRMMLTREQDTAHRYLLTYAAFNDGLDDSLKALEHADSARYSVTGAIEAMGVSGAQKDKMAVSLANFDDAVDKIARLSYTYLETFSEMEEFLAEVQRRDFTAGKVLRMRYMRSMEVKQMAKELAYTDKTVYALVKRGLDVAYDVLSEE